MINFAPFISMLLRNKSKQPKKKLTASEKKEIDKVNNMGLFTAIDYCKNK